MLQLFSAELVSELPCDCMCLWSDVFLCVLKEDIWVNFMAKYPYKTENGSQEHPAYLEPKL